MSNNIDSRFRVSIDFDGDGYLGIYPNSDKLVFRYMGTFEVTVETDDSFLIYTIPTKNIYNLPYFITIKETDSNGEVIKHRERNFAIIHEDEITTAYIEVEVFYLEEWRTIYNSTDGVMPAWI